MSEYLTIDVTAEDIATGVIGNCLKCPLALAVKRAVRNSISWAGPIDIYDGFDYYATSPDAQRFIDDFDHGCHVEPTVFRFARRSR